ncbi:CDP-glycerol glycerophosphotransferase family protein [Pseudomonas jinjuensis]|uniref:CDP-glycerol glycerophosphotransferase, TagB/SpsB family n=1 Tax=Pseudomonas jinjuensis TaxID=198616 RepID=A0A1H0AX34_9PSED|nr:CDP-glycerol glycerophosphotransferase family protein [Pseudomonas jinjuensis]SDN37831.1 CDP-glycerol glycerophosphotransferase, TagB/SpsB family [Pseudomonas jinjuensis]
MNYNNFHKRSLFIKAIYPLLWPIALLSKLTPKNKNIKIFSSMSGYQIADNAKYLFLNTPINNRRWITKNKELCKSATITPRPIYAYSLRGIYLQLTAKEAYFTHSIFDFVPMLIMGSKIINLWHGVPLKEIGPPSDWKNKSVLRRRILTIYYKVFKYAYYMHCDTVVCPEKSLEDDYKRFFSIPNPKIKIEKQARNTFSKKQEKRLEILYAPTHRMQIPGSNIKDTLEKTRVFSKIISDFLKKHDIVLVIRPHPIDSESIKSIDLLHPYILDTSIDIYESINKYALVITDYSSLFYDSNELNIPCMVVAHDPACYIKAVGLTPKYQNILSEENKFNFESAIPTIKKILKL